MFSSSNQSYQESFPPLEKQTDPQTKVVSQPFMQSPITSSGQLEAPNQYEAVLNWQTQNSNAQNQALHNFERKMDKVATQVTKTKTKVDSINAQLEQIYLNLQNIISKLDLDLITMINNRIWGLEFNKKEAKIRKLKAELAKIDADKEQPSLFTKLNLYQFLPFDLIHINLSIILLNHQWTTTSSLVFLIFFTKIQNFPQHFQHPKSQP